MYVPIVYGFLPEINVFVPCDRYSTEYGMEYPSGLLHLHFIVYLLGYNTKHSTGCPGYESNLSLAMSRIHTARNRCFL